MYLILYLIITIMTCNLTRIKCVTITPKNTNVEPYKQIQNMITNMLKNNTTRNEQQDEVVLPWKRPTTVLEYHKILHFNDDNEIVNNHICHCHVEKIPEDGFNRILNKFNNIN